MQINNAIAVSLAANTIKGVHIISYVRAACARAYVCVGEVVDVDRDRHRVAHRSVFSVRAGVS